MWRSRTTTIGCWFGPSSTVGRPELTGGAEDTVEDLTHGPRFNNATILPVAMIGAIAYQPGGFGVEEGRATGGVVGITTDAIVATAIAGEASVGMTEVEARVVAPVSRAHHVSVQ